jgi:hypothetical protein
MVSANLFACCSFVLDAAASLRSNSSNDIPSNFSKREQALLDGDAAKSVCLSLALCSSLKRTDFPVSAHKFLPFSASHFFARLLLGFAGWLLAAA